MDINTITTLVSTVGFPIAVSFVCFWYIYKREKQMKKEIDALSESLNNNTLVMQKLVDKLSND